MELNNVSRVACLLHEKQVSPKNRLEKSQTLLEKAGTTLQFSYGIIRLRVESRYKKKRRIEIKVEWWQRNERPNGLTTNCEFAFDREREAEREGGSELLGIR